ncbi:MULTISPECIES: PAS domain S-box protein [Haloferax]|uniref:PAS domain S-box protein n=2 Tax=Haloferax TaxID=2251 RepID=A0A6G1Z7G0_9EURY|nr:MULTISPECIES: PAS domain S-box protein [Haloferax]KAB1185067.1 PAS domain-containing sensor histidine kinase [Haloferax sp. CBA1149]MRW82244.1 PAS domain S-box protein [Haloferax marinisediminis]
MDETPLDTHDGRAIATAYVGFGAVGILGGELVLSTLLGTPMASPLAIGKGLLFVVVSSVFVGFLVNRKNQRIARQQASVRTSLTKLENVVSASPVPIISVTPDKQVTRWNEAATETFGWTQEEVLGKQLPEVTSDRPVSVDQILDQTTEEEGLSNLEVELRRRDGSVGEFLLSTAVIRDDDGDVVELVGVFVDTTAQKQRERRLREFEMAVEQAGHAIYLTTPDGKITYVNPAFEHITGYTRDEAVGETPDILKSGEMDGSYYESLWETVESGDTWHERIVDQRKSGEFYTAVQTIAPIHQGDESIGYVAIQSDITESELAKQRLGVLNRMFRHNLRNRMNVIDGYAEMIRTDAANEETLDRANNIVTAANELVALAEKAQTVADLLESDGSTRYVVELIDEAVTRAQSYYPDSTATVDVEPGISELVDNRVGVAVNELVTNSLEHGGETVHVDVFRSPRNDERLVIRVSDDGPGLPKGEWDAIERGRETPLEHGTGMGLWLVHWVVTKAGGSTRLGTTPLGGAAVTLELPIDDGDDDARDDSAGVERTLRGTTLDSTDE